MAFGKEQSHLANIPAFGGSLTQKAQTAARRTTRPGGGGGGAPYWKDTYSLPDLQPDTIRLVPGAYEQRVPYPDAEGNPVIVTDVLPYVAFREHHNGRRGAVCSAGPLWRSKADAEPCPSCEVYWEDFRERMNKKDRGDTTKGPNRMSVRDQYAFNVFDYGLYFEVPDVDRNGQPRLNQKTKQPFTHWEKGNVNDPKYHGLPWKQGHLLAWPMAETYKTTIIGYNKKIGMSCTTCGSMNSIRCVVKTCAGCNQPIYNPNDTTLTTEQQEKVDYEPFTCPHCNHYGFVSEILECSTCQNPQRATVFDVDLQVQRMGLKGKQTFLQIFAYSEPRRIQVQDPTVLEQIKPLDLLKKYAPTAPDEQQRIMGIQAAPAPMQAQQPMMGTMQPNVQQQITPQAQQPPQMQQPQMQQYTPPVQQQQPQIGQQPMMGQPQMQPMQQQPVQQPTQAPPVVPYNIPPQGTPQQ